ncbi:MAG TPA: serine/threonine-protein kinase [Verrucomicrobiae bacterium]|nr:serine/threonine-protein kinase [Verrucomicrobiae bacterium]
MALRHHKFFRPAIAATLTAACGLLLLCTPQGDAWVNASYDYLFRFVARTSTLPVVLIEMDNDSYEFFHQKRGEHERWDRALHAQLLERLAQDGCRLVVFDSWFHEPMDPAKDKALADALQRQPAVVLMAGAGGPFLKNAISPDADMDSVEPFLPAKIFRDAANNHWGIAGLDPVGDGGIVRRHWPFPASGADNLPSLPWAAATLFGAKLSEQPQEQWLRYYSQEGAWDAMSYRLWTNQVAGYFRNKIVFIGNRPASPDPGLVELDKFSVPYTRWTSEAVGGVEVLATEFLNLVNGDWLRRPAGWVEVAMVILVGAFLGAGLCHVRPLRAGGLAIGVAGVVAVGAMYLTHKTNYWFPWLVIAGGQAPCALLCALIGHRVFVPASELRARSSNAQNLDEPLVEDVPHAPDYEIFSPAFGEGGYGKVWLARNAIGQWQALKAVYRSKFGSNAKPYDREFNGIRRYKPISDKHPGLLRVDFVSKKKSQDYFYYVMELGDSLETGWENNPATYKPKDLAKVLERAESKRLPGQECLRITLALAEALDFLHGQSLTHGDIKPQNIIFVENQPKLADVGLVNDLPEAGQNPTGVGTLGYMPPDRKVGTPQADIYGLGMVLYVMFTGREPSAFPSVATSLVDDLSARADFIPINSIVLRACHPDPGMRYDSALTMASAVRDVLANLEAQLV